MKKYLLLILVAILVAMALTLASCQKVENPPEPAPGNGEHVHTPGDWIVIKDPTCIDPGEQLQFCTSCKELLHRMPVYDAWVHKPDVTIERKEPTCTEPGYTAETRCSVCDSVVDYSTVLSALGHTFSVWTFVEDGKERSYCHCGEGETVREFSKGLEFTLNDDGVSYSVTGIGTCAVTDIVIPHVYNGLPVTEIGCVFAYNKDITSVSIPNSITSIHSRAFYGCSSLKTIIIPDSVVTIGKEAFRGAALETACFVDAQGWGYSKYQLGNNVTPISAEDLANPAIAAKYLVTDYVGNWWKNK